MDEMAQVGEPRIRSGTGSFKNLKRVRVRAGAMGGMEDAWARNKRNGRERHRD